MSEGIVVTARVDSKRLPNKALKRIGKDSVILSLLKNVVQNNPLPVVVATPDDENNKVIERVIRDENVPVHFYSGENEEPGKRILAVAKKYGWEYVYYAPCDYPLLDQRIMHRQINFALKNKLDYCYINKMPLGTAGEVIKVSVLEQVLVESKNTEYFSYLLMREGINSCEYRPPVDYCYNARLAVDCYEDLQLLRIINNNLSSKHTLLTVIDFLKRNEYLLNFNYQPDISVLITNYNYSNYVVNAIASIAAQTEQNWECFIYDDCSTDNSLNKIVNYLSALNRTTSKKFIVRSMPKNVGLGSLCNLALHEVRGKFYIRLDADDLLRNDALQIMKSKLSLDHTVAGAWSGYRRFGAGKEQIITPDDAEYEWHPACCLLRTDTVLATGYRDKYDFYEGADFLDKYRDKYKIVKCQEPLWARRMHADQMTGPDTQQKRRRVATELSYEGINV